MNHLLLRQLRKHLPELDWNAEPWRRFLAAVSTAYDESQEEERFLTRTLEIASAELTEANEKLRQESESRLQSLNRYYRQTLELQQGMILCFRRTERGFEHTLCRGQLAERLGWSPSSVEGKLPGEFLPAVQAEILQAAYQRAWNGEECAIEIKSAAGSADILMQLRPRREAGEICEVIVACVEITALKRFEADLRAAKDRAESADRAKSEFLAVMSHEIRTPLNGVLGFCQLLKESPLDADQITLLATLEASGESLRTMIDDLFDFSKIESAKLELNPQPLELQPLLESIAATFRPRAAQKGLSFDLELSDRLPTMIVTDGARLRQILVNLVGNAIKFTQQGGVQIIASAEIDPADAGECRLRCEVRDSGIGIAPEHRGRIFKPFSQADSSSTRTFGGTGLGLAICKRLCVALGGDIDYDSEPGAGSSFFFNIRVGLKAVLPSPFGSPSLETFALPSLRILVAEDHPVNRLLIKQMLQRFGYAPDFVEDGAKAVAATAKTDYDLIVMDLLMPEMDGFEATKEIRSRLNGRPQPRIVALTASLLAGDHKRCFEVGMNAVLTKPVRAEALRAELARTQPRQAA